MATEDSTDPLSFCFSLTSGDVERLQDQLNKARAVGEFVRYYLEASNLVGEVERMFDVRGLRLPTGTCWPGPLEPRDISAIMYLQNEQITDYESVVSTAKQIAR